MSRHKLCFSDGRSVIIGFDRPIGAFFCQEWHKDNEDQPFAEDDCVDLDAFDDHYMQSDAVRMPEALRLLLIREAAGEADTNVCKTWGWCLV